MIFFFPFDLFFNRFRDINLIGLPYDCWHYTSPKADLNMQDRSSWLRIEAISKKKKSTVMHCKERSLQKQTKKFSCQFIMICNSPQIYSCVCVSWHISWSLHSSGSKKLKSKSSMIPPPNPSFRIIACLQTNQIVKNDCIGRQSLVVASSHTFLIRKLFSLCP